VAARVNAAEAAGAGSLLAVSDLHVSNRESREIVERFAPRDDGDWLIVCGDISESIEECEWALALLSRRFAKVIWTPGNHELWTLPREAPELRGERLYRHLLDICRRHGVLTPEDPFPVWEGGGGPVTVAPLFLLYDYSFGRNVAPTKAAALAHAERVGVVCSDEFLLHPDPYPSREAWCRARVELTEARLEACDPELPTVLVNHFPLLAESTRALWYPEFAQWCGTDLTADWHRRFRASVVVYGHLHIPRTTWHDGVRFEEVSLGYPREFRFRRSAPSVPRRILPVAEAP
jgi:3',5'-cyclic AMP phosphodiesterase CpdA